ncbi:MAG: hypothetical protein EA374_07270 [Acholeplasmatales bacterium]|nr:MAG: hypothetical protein EA374_07270 [Acholeplasmatales bacterium]
MLNLKRNDQWTIVAFTVLITFLTMVVRLVSGVPFVWMRALIVLPLMYVTCTVMVALYRRHEAWLPLSGVKKGMLYGALIGAVWTLVRLENWYLRGLFSLRTVDIGIIFISFLALGMTMGLTNRTQRHLLMQDARSLAPLGLAFLAGRVIHRLITAWSIRPFVSGRLVMIWGLGTVLFALLGVYAGGIIAKKNPRPGAAFTLVGLLAPVMVLSWLAEWPLYLGFDAPPFMQWTTVLVDLVFVGIGFAVLLAHKCAIRRLD